MGLFETINEDLKTAMKEKNADKLTALRAVKSELLLLKTSGAGKEINEQDELKVLQKMVKQRKDSAEIYKNKGREDLYEKEMTEADYISAYLPEQMSDEELTEAVAEIISETGATSLKDMGKVMSTASKKLAGRAEGKLIAEKVKQLLS
ncbi:MAG: GatB/YqeY domain-containing protein [Chlorobi bacterium]|nr:GatB/YqeY domain-containing protein [Chlorobiota bacterium]